ncbi:MAG TPA: NUDIX domain-containing protein [Parafilimonas sp.]|nr:NUDIX domain-containing protein [Parafilimonas sp.]
MAKKIIAAGGLVFNDKNELLMIFRRGKWDLPKGKLDKGETIEDCAVREVKEETGLENVSIKNFAGITFHEYFEPRIHDDVLKESHWYKMHAPGDQQLVPQTEEDIEMIEWVDAKQIPGKLENSYANIVEIIQKSTI